ncbi:hypothetical protein K461DRAFT_79873 [Myriangium duriaei CBS 260.36]|uniref:Uncharacterized protein n=1 Tax=Myriangium duriaei CBS 260.36 TaxID=1168546 RepID=A0A9P4J603_9PEZI|nr:hypothetical protein K461DRAFT_79873 [Myriangium duriaei CBS 260.36]
MLDLTCHAMRHAEMRSDQIRRPTSETVIEPFRADSDRPRSVWSLESVSAAEAKQVESQASRVKGKYRRGVKSKTGHVWTPRSKLCATHGSCHLGAPSDSITLTTSSLASAGPWALVSQLLHPLWWLPVILHTYWTAALFGGLRARPQACRRQMPKRPGVDTDRRENAPHGEKGLSAFSTKLWNKPQCQLRDGK